MAVGHEYSGEIVEIGSEVRGFEIGDRVSGEGHVTCGYCRNCRAGRRHLCRNTVGVGVNRPGCFAEYLVIPAFNAFKLSDSITDEVASILDPLGNATHTALSFNLVGEDVLITGAGPIGIMATAIARFVGARHIVVTDVNDYRLGLAQEMGASRAINVTRESLDDTMKQLGMQEGFDVGLEMSGNPSAFRLRPGDVRDLVQDVRDAPERPRRRSCHHARAACRRVPGRLRDHEERPVGQGDPGLGCLSTGCAAPGLPGLKA